MVGVFDSRAVDKGFEPRSGQVKGYNISIGCFSNKHVVWMRNSKDWLAMNQGNVEREVYLWTVVSANIKIHLSQLI
jgi:hypothetical protein